MKHHDPNIATPKVTTGQLPLGKVMRAPTRAPDLRVPVREIVADGGPPASRRGRVFTTHGPVTDPGR